MSTATSAPQHDRAQLDALRQDRGALVRALTDAGAEHVGDSGTLRCPFHEDEHASGSIREKGGAWRFKCFACAASGDVFDVTMKARGVAFPQAADLLTGAEQPGDGKRKTRARAGTPKPNGRVYPTFDEAVEATRRGIERVGGCRVEVAQHWVYLDASGERESFRIIRFDTPKGKTFRPTFHDAHGWQVRRPDGLAWPYRWPEIGEGDVYVLEGEGCVDLARDQLGLNATTSAGGAKAPDRTEWRALAGRRVNVIPDAGKAGISYAHRVVEILLALDPPADPRIVELRGLEDGQDIEQFAEGKHPDQVRTEIERLAANVVVTAIADKTEPHDFPLTDTGNAERLIERHGRDLHHTRSHGWLHWIGTHWDRDITGAVERCAVETVRDMYARTANLELAKPRQTLAAFARSSESWKRLRDMIRIAQSQESVAITADALDCDRMLLNVGNGTVDLKTGTLREHRRDDLITRVCPVAYDPNAEAPLWLRFLGDVMGGDEDLIGFLRRAVGHSLTGDTSERCLFLLHGGGKNGKSTFLAACRAAMGDYALHARAETIMAKRGDSIP
ncbi:MAG: hypothetical protein IH986_19185, partial [Planctomycetes bacterium]|nr:hypothetical protein [Planctomycetota bacterium]